MENTAQDTANMTSEEALCSPVDHKTRKRPGFSNLKLFIVALSFAYFSKALTGTYMKSSITQIERRFDLSSTHIGLIDGSFEMGNLLFLAVVSHFGAKLHRPRLIAAGCFLMAVGAFLTGLTHFFMGRYKYDTVIQVFQNDNLSIAACVDPLKTLDHVPEIQIEPSLEDNKACVRDSGSSMWIYVFLGNALRGIGETPVTPLGISYIDDFAKAENSPFYIACLQTITLLGPMFGFLLGSYCARLYVDIGYVDMGVLNLPAVAIGIFLGGLLMKRYKLSVVSGAQLSFATSFMSYLLMLLQFGTKCDNIPIAGLTVSYNGTKGVLYSREMLFSECNRDCLCSAEEWDPVCSDSGITYISPCMAGCLSSSGHGKNTVFHNCTCVSTSFPAGSSTSVRLGQCPHAKDCSRSFTSYMAISVLSSFINALGATPGYMVIIRCITPELKSLALGIQTLVTRTLGGIPAPVYFGALIDSTCLKWSMKSCGGRGACRIYNSDMYRIIFLGLITCISGSSYFFLIAVIILLRRQFRKPEKDTDKQEQKASKDFELKTPLNLTEEIRASPETPNLPSATKIWVKIATDLEEGGEVHTVELPPHNDGVISTSNAQEAKYMTDTCAEVIPLSSDGTNTEIVRKESIGHKVIEKQDDHIDDKSKLEKERQQLN
ncbi:solute carrier organic anion transporter family member 1C1 isoform X2 [Haplochromis burtoni]|uniref:solute carrier organic anion transporter family member 1C1 isoform X2 n=1 Tax=Haplochromis burtoni TaxID=8153 RepID=UPI001C2D192E|nr:solute carrier organic anion transporter family member 1C1 isoform X2 [Haplochromis burtoni]